MTLQLELDIIFQLLMSGAVHRWGSDILEGVYNMLQLLVDLVATRLLYKPVPIKLLGTLAQVNTNVSSLHQLSNNTSIVTTIVFTIPSARYHHHNMSRRVRILCIFFCRGNFDLSYDLRLVYWTNYSLCLHTKLTWVELDWFRKFRTGLTKILHALEQTDRWIDFIQIEAPFSPYRDHFFAGVKSWLSITLCLQTKLTWAEKFWTGLAKILGR